MTPKPWRVLASLSAAVAVAGIALTTGQVATALTTSSGEQGRIHVSYEPDPAIWTGVHAGDRLHWRLRISVAGATSADLRLQLSGSGPLLAQDLRIAVDQCQLDPADAACTGPRSSVLAMPLEQAVGARQWRLIDVDLTHHAGLFVTLSIPETAAVEGHTDVGLGLTAAGDTPRPVADRTVPASSAPFHQPETGPGEDPQPVASPPPLAFTGLDLLGPALLAVGMIGAGTGLRYAGRRR